MKKIYKILFLLIVLCVCLNGKAQTYQINDTIICTNVDNVKKTALRVLELEQEKFIAVGIAAEAEANNDIKDKEIDRLNKEIKKINRKIAVSKFVKPIKETSKAAIYTGVGLLIGLQMN